MGTNERREREKLKRRQDILEAARRLFFDKGFRDTTINDIAHVTELARGTIYLYFESKEDVYATVMEEGLDILHELVRQSYNPDTDALTNLLAGHDAFITFHDRHPELYNVLTMDKLQITPALPAELKDRLDAKFMIMVQWIAHVLKEGIEQRIFRAMPVQEVALMQMGIAMGFTQMTDKCGANTAISSDRDSMRQVLHDLIAGGVISRTKDPD